MFTIETLEWSWLQLAIARFQGVIDPSKAPHHNTPANRSGPLALGSYNSSNTTMDISLPQECHLAKLRLLHNLIQLGLIGVQGKRKKKYQRALDTFKLAISAELSIPEAKSASWEEEEKTNYCLRYFGPWALKFSLSFPMLGTNSDLSCSDQREEAEIQAYVNLWKAKVEAQSRKLGLLFISSIISKLEIASKSDKNVLSHEWNGRIVVWWVLLESLADTLLFYFSFMVHLYSVPSPKYSDTLYPCNPLEESIQLYLKSHVKVREMVMLEEGDSSFDISFKFLVDKDGVSN